MFASRYKLVLLSFMLVGLGPNFLAQVLAQETIVREAPLHDDGSSGTVSGTRGSQESQAPIATADRIIVAQSDGSTGTSIDRPEATGKRESDNEREINTLNQFTLPRSAAPVAVDTNLRTGSPVGSNTQSALRRPPGVKTDSAIGFFPSLALGVTWVDNPARTAGPIASQQDDLIYSIAPVLVYRNAIKNRHAYELGIAAVSDNYQDFTNLDTTNVTYSAAINLDMTKILMGDLYYSYTDGADPRGSTATRIADPRSDPDEFKRDIVGGRITLGRRSNTLQAVFGLQYGEIDYTNNNQDDRDREDAEFSTGLFWNTTPSTSFFTRARFRDIDYVEPVSSGLNSEETSLTVGVGWEPTFKTSIILEVGALQKDVIDPTVEDYDDLTYTGRISWSPTARSRTGFFASRRTEESTDFDSPFIVSTLFGFNGNYLFTDRISGGAYINYIEDEYVELREDEIIDYGLKFNYDWLKWMTVGAGWSHTDRDSTDPIATYDTDRFFITATMYTTRPLKFGSIQTSDQVIFGN